MKEAEHRPYLHRLFPDWVERVRYWHVHDLDRAPADEALAEIDQLVRGLIAELARCRGHGRPPRGAISTS